MIIFFNSRSPMEKNITKHCTYANSCRECSLFIIDQHLDKAADIWWNETCSKMKNYEPVTTVKIGITNEIRSINQTRCCKGQRTLFFTGIYQIWTYYFYCNTKQLGMGTSTKTDISLSLLVNILYLLQNLSALYH